MLTDLFLPLLTYPDAGSEDLIDAALGLCKQFGTGVAFCAFEIDIPEIAYSLGSELIDVSALIAEAEKLSHSNAERLGRHIASMTDGIPVTSTTVRMRQEQVTQAAVVMARCRDMSIEQLLPNAIGQRQLVEGLVFGAGRPVMVLPKAPQRGWNIDHVAIAWDGGRAATRAVHDAMDLLARAQAVTVLTAFDDKVFGERVVSDLVGYLARHGVEANHHVVNSEGGTIGEALQSGAIDHGAGMLVMGAFGHSRIREFVLGGATRSTLDDVRLPIFMCH